jgi:hypothetical protein
MTTVNHTTNSHPGLLVTGAGDEIEIEIELIGGRTLRMSASGDELGAWPIEECHIEPDPARHGSFRVKVDGDDAVFTPTDPVGFRALVSRILDDEAAAVPESPSPAVGALPTAGPVAADDPVAFLFGSSPPPQPQPELVFEDWSDPDDAPPPETSTPVTEDQELFDFEDSPVDPSSESDAAEVADVGFAAPSVADVPEIRVVTDVSADDAVVEDDATDIERWEDELFATESDTDDSSVLEAQADADPAAVLDLEPAPDFEPVSDVVSMADVEPVPGLESVSDLEPVSDVESVSDFGPIEGERATDLRDEEELRGRFGGSALDRLSAAIGSMKAHASTDHDPDSGDEEYELGPNTVAEDVLTTQRTLRDHRLKSAARGKYLKWTGFGVGALLVIAFFVFLTPRAISFVQNYEGDAEPPPTLPVTETTVAPTTTVPSDTESPATTTPIAGDGTIFDRPAPDFISTWNATGGPIDPVLEFDAFPPLGPFEERFTPFLALTAVVHPDGTLDDFSLVVDPSGPTEYDRIGIQALGVAIATVEPERSPEGRATLLGQLGLNVRQPLLDGIDGTVETDGLVYRLVYDNATTLLTLTVSPA